MLRQQSAGEHGPSPRSASDVFRVRLFCTTVGTILPACSSCLWSSWWFLSGWTPPRLTSICLHRLRNHFTFEETAAKQTRGQKKTTNNGAINHNNTDTHSVRRDSCTKPRSFSILWCFSLLELCLFLWLVATFLLLNYTDSVKYIHTLQCIRRTCWPVTWLNLYFLMSDDNII